jgi:hypothetical protein
VLVHVCRMTQREGTFERMQRAKKKESGLDSAGCRLDVAFVQRLSACASVRTALAKFYSQASMKLSEHADPFGRRMRNRTAFVNGKAQEAVIGACCLSGGAG